MLMTLTTMIINGGDGQGDENELNGKDDGDNVDDGEDDDTDGVDDDDGDDEHDNDNLGDDDNINGGGVNIDNDDEDA